LRNCREPATNPTSLFRKLNT